MFQIHQDNFAVDAVWLKAEVSFDQLVQQKSDGRRARIVAITHQISKAQMQQVVTAIQNTEAFQLLNVMKVIGDE